MKIQRTIQAKQQQPIDASGYNVESIQELFGECPEISDFDSKNRSDFDIDVGLILHPE